MYVCSQILKLTGTDRASEVCRELQQRSKFEFTEELGQRSKLQVQSHFSYKEEGSQKKSPLKEEPVFAELDLELSQSHKSGSTIQKLKVFKGLLASGKSIVDTRFAPRNLERLSDSVEFIFEDPSCDLDDELCEREFKNQTVEEILRIVLGERGWSLSCVGERNPKIDSIMLQEGETAWTFAQRLVGPLGLFLSYDHQAKGNAKRLRLLSPDFTASSRRLKSEEIMGAIETQFRPSSFVDEVIAGDFSGGVKTFKFDQFRAFGAGPSETHQFRSSSGLFTALRKRLMNSPVSACDPELIEGVFLERMIHSYRAAWFSNQYLEVGTLVSLEPLKSVSIHYSGEHPFIILKRVSRFSDSTSTWQHSYIGVRP